MITFSTPGEGKAAKIEPTASASEADIGDDLEDVANVEAAEAERPNKSGRATRKASQNVRYKEARETGNVPSHESLAIKEVAKAESEAAAHEALGKGAKSFRYARADENAITVGTGALLTHPCEGLILTLEQIFSSLRIESVYKTAV